MSRSVFSPLSPTRERLPSQLAKQLRHYRAQKRGQLAEEQLEAAMMRSSEAVSQAFHAKNTSPSKQAARREEAVILADVLASMSPEYREVLVLRHLEGHDFPSIARQLGRELENVKSLWRRSLRELQQQVASLTEE